jgi:hypothetical protein
MADLSPEKFVKSAPAEDEIKTDQIEPPDEEEGKEEEDAEEKVNVLEFKAGPEAEGADEADVEAEAEIPPPSSPLGNKVAEDALDESPTRTVSRPVSRPVSRREPGPFSNGINGLDRAGKLAPPPAQPKFSINSVAVNAPSFKMYQPANGDVDDEDDDGIDLSK